ncbi:MAG: hypothetical protein MZV64_62470 [Ignavibacteriales bacterium]|nr:hypothetical protein [Ignavibacteriales bacterium]
MTGTASSASRAGRMMAAWVVLTIYVLGHGCSRWLLFISQFASGLVLRQGPDLS